MHKHVSLLIVFLLLLAGCGVLLYFIIDPDPLDTKPLVARDQFIGSSVYIDKVVAPAPSILQIVHVSAEGSTNEADRLVSAYILLPAGTHRGVEISADESSEVLELTPGFYAAVLHADADNDGQYDEAIDVPFEDLQGNAISTIFRLK